MREQVRGRGGSDEHGDHQRHADRLKRDRDGHRDEREQEIIEHSNGEAQCGGKDRVEGQGHELLVEREDGEEDKSAEYQDQPQALSRDAQHIPEEEVGQIHSVAADGGDQRDSKREHPREDDSDCRILPDPGIFADRPDSQRGKDRCPQSPPEQDVTRAAADEVTQRDAREDRMRKRIAEECHAAQYNIRADHRAHNADEDRGDHAALHEFVGERLKQEINDGVHSRHHRSNHQLPGCSLPRWSAVFHRTRSTGCPFATPCRDSRMQQLFC